MVCFSIRGKKFTPVFFLLQSFEFHKPFTIYCINITCNMFDGIIYKYTCIPTGLSYVGQAIGDGSIRHSQFMSLGTRYTSGRSAIDNARRKYMVLRLSHMRFWSV